MSVYAQFGEDGPQDQMASNLGWAEFTGWVDGLDYEDYAELVHLCDHGWCQRLGELEAELKAVAANAAPGDPNVGKTLAALAECVNNRGKEEVFCVTDGMGKTAESRN